MPRTATVHRACPGTQPRRTMLLVVVTALIGLMLGPAGPVHAAAALQRVLFYGPTAGGLAQATPGIVATVWNEATWASKTTADFAAFNAIVFGDQPGCGVHPDAWATAISNRDVWSAAVTGNVTVNGTDPDAHSKVKFVQPAVTFAASGVGTGLYVSLSCAYQRAQSPVDVALLGAFGTFRTQSPGASSCPDNAHIVAANPSLTQVDDAYLSGWMCSAHEGFTQWPTSFTPLVMVTDASTAPYLASDGTRGLVYVLASSHPTVNKPVPGTFRSIPPARLLDTRSGNGPVGANQSVVVPIAGRGGVPASGAVAVVVNVTATAPTAAGFITAYADGTNRPPSSNLNFTAGQTIPNLVVVPVGVDGKIRLFNGSAGTTHLIADVAGYYVPGLSSVPGALRILTPARVLDTRSGAPVGSNRSVAVQIAGRGGVPATGAGAVIINVTATTPTGAGFITASADGSTRPDVSNLNFTRGQTVPNLVVVPIGADGKINLFNGSAGTTHLIGDIAGYYLPGTPTVAGTFRSLPPVRILDTRSGNGTQQTPVLANSNVTVQIAGRGGVPLSGAAAVVINVTAAAPTAVGFITAFADFTTRPNASNLNFTRGQTVPNLVVVPIGTDGKINLFNGSAGTTDFVGDVAGYFLSS